VGEIRKLAAILVSDVVGYSRLTGADEDRILARLRALRSDLVDPTIAVHHGRVVKRTGDGAIVEFRSVVDAVNFRARTRKPSCLTSCSQSDPAGDELGFARADEAGRRPAPAGRGGALARPGAGAFHD
jgi:class 3 adenylate cyclase